MVMDPNSAVAEPEVAVQINAPSDNDVCTWTSDVDEKRRAFVVSQMANCDVDGKILVQNMHAVCEWLKSGKVPDARVDGSRSVPRVVA
jgi:hypothetical protein